MNYESENSPIIEVVEQEECLEKDINYIFVLYLLHGVLTITCGTIVDHTLTGGDFMLFPPGSRIHVRVDTPVRVMLLRVKGDITLCENYTLENLYCDRDIRPLRHTHLESRRIIRSHMESLAENIDNGLRCVRFLEIKMEEFFYYLRAYYSKDELAGFCLPLLSSDARFMNFIWENYRRIRTVEQFARLANSSPSAFKIKFKKITGKSVSRWILEHKARNVYRDICFDKKSLKDITEEYHFASVSHLGAFCRKHFGKSPSRIRPHKSWGDQ